VTPTTRAQLTRMLALVARRTGLVLGLATHATEGVFVYVGDPSFRISPPLPPEALLFWLDAFAEGHAFGNLACAVPTRAAPPPSRARKGAKKRSAKPPVAPPPTKPPARRQAKPLAKRAVPPAPAPPARGLWLVPKPRGR